MKRFHTISFLVGFCVMGLLSEGVLYEVNAGWQRTIENHKNLERTLMDRIELRDQQDMAASHETATVKTVLIEDAHAGGQSPCALPAIRAAWTVPGRVVPHTDDGRAGAYYTYLDSTGHIDGWRNASRDEVSAVLYVTGPAAPADSNAGAITITPGQALNEILKASKGRP